MGEVQRRRSVREAVTCDTAAMILPHVMVACLALSLVSCQIEMKEAPRPFVPVPKSINLLTLESAPIPYSGPHQPTWGPIPEAPKSLPSVRVRYTPVHASHSHALELERPSHYMTQAILSIPKPPRKQQLDYDVRPAESWQQPFDNGFRLQNATLIRNFTAHDDNFDFMQPPRISAVSEYSTYQRRKNKRKKFRPEHYRPAASHNSPVIYQAPLNENLKIHVFHQPIQQASRPHATQQHEQQSPNTVTSAPVRSSQLPVPSLIIKTRELSPKPEHSMSQLNYGRPPTFFPPANSFRPAAPIEFNFPPRGPPSLSPRIPLQNGFSTPGPIPPPFPQHSGAVGPNFNPVTHTIEGQFGNMDPPQDLSSYPPVEVTPEYENDWVPIKSRGPIIKHYHVEPDVTANQKNALNIQHLREILKQIPPPSDAVSHGQEGNSFLTNVLQHVSDVTGNEVEVQKSLNVFQGSSIIYPKDHLDVQGNAQPDFSGHPKEPHNNFPGQFQQNYPESVQHDFPIEQQNFQHESQGFQGSNQGFEAQQQQGFQAQQQQGFQAQQQQGFQAQQQQGFQEQQQQAFQNQQQGFQNHQGFQEQQQGFQRQPGHNQPQGFANQQTFQGYERQPSGQQQQYDDTQQTYGGHAQDYQSHHEGFSNEQSSGQTVNGGQPRENNLQLYQQSSNQQEHARPNEHVKSSTATFIAPPTTSATPTQNSVQSFNAEYFLQIKDKDSSKKKDHSSEQVLPTRRSAVIESESSQHLVKHSNNLPAGFTAPEASKQTSQDTTRKHEDSGKMEPSGKNETAENTESSNTQEVKTPEVTSSKTRVSVQSQMRSERQRSLENVKRASPSTQPVLVYPETSMHSSFVTPKTLLGQRFQESKKKQAKYDVEIIPSQGHIVAQEITHYHY